ncbi:MAG: peptidylprolyl isomerase, partial [Paludibacteraceae bacterium]|nr:peptidylprolyl isomerase [Paludibacteraceae bacterium]
GKVNNVALSANMLDPNFREFAFSGKNGEVSGPKLYGSSYKMARIIDNTISSPDSIRIKHIVIAENDSVATKTLADSVLNALNGGADFAALAKKYSKMQQTAQNGGDAGWILTAQIDNDKLLSALNSHPNNVNFQFKEESNAIQIIQITDRTKAVRKAKLAIIESEVAPSKETTAKNFNLAKGFAGSSKDVAAFEANAKKNGYNIYPYTTLTANLPNLQNLENSRSIIQWAFNENTEKGAVSDVYECGNYFIVASLKDIEPKGYRTLANDEVKDQIKYLVLRDKKAEILTKELGGAKDLNALAAKLQLSVDSANQINFASTSIAKVGFEPSVIAAIALGKQGQVSKPIKGNQGVYVVNVTKQVPSTNKLDEKAELQAITTRQLYSVYRSVDALIDNNEIVDNRKNFY